MTERNDDNTTEITVRDPFIAEQRDMMEQLIRQVAELAEKVQRNEDLTNLVITTNNTITGDKRPPFHIPLVNTQIHEHYSNNPPISSAPKSSLIDLTTPNPSHLPNPSHIGTSYQTPPPLAQNAKNSQNFPPIYQTTIPNIQNPPNNQAIPQTNTFHIPTLPEPCPTFIENHEIDHYEEKEKEWRVKEEKHEREILSVKEEVAKAMKAFHVSSDVVGLNYEDLCIHPNLDLPEGYKVPKFETFSGVGNPMAHLRGYCDQLVGVGKNEALLMRLFSRSLSGEALEWFTSQELKQWSSWRDLAKDFIERFAYNIEVVPDRYSLEKIKQKTTECYREYAYRWRKEAARVRPPMAEQEIVEVFVRIQEPEYYDRMILIVRAKFAELVKIGETIEDGLKTGKIARVSTPAGSLGFVRKKKEEVSSVSFSPSTRSRKSYGSSPTKTTPLKPYPPTPQSFYPVFYAQPNHQTPSPNYQTPPLNYQNTQPNFQAHLRNYHPNVQTPNPYNYHQVPPSTQNSYNLPRPNLEKKPTRNFTPLAESRTQLFERLKTAGLIQPIQSKPTNTNSRFFKADQYCAYHSGGAGHTTEDCINLKYKIQDLIDQRVITLQTAAPNVNTNPLPNHEGSTVSMIETDEEWIMSKAMLQASTEKIEKSVAALSIGEKPQFVVMTAPHQAFALVPAKKEFVVEAAAAHGMTRSGRCYTPEDLVNDTYKKENQKRPITEGEAEEFWRRMQPKEYSIVKHLEKTPAQISVWALLMSSQYHRQALLRVLDEAYVPTGTSSETLAAMISRVMGNHKICFSEDELPFEGMMHNKALHITVKCRDQIISRVLIDDGSGLNICPLYTLTQLNYDMGKIRQSQVNVRAFDGGQRDTLGEVDLCIQLGPAEFQAEFQVMDITTSYNLLLGRPWIHMAGAVSSTLHQLMKFVWKDHEVIIHGEKGHLSHPNGCVPMIEDIPRDTDFYTVEIVNVAEEDLTPQPLLPSVYKMLATSMLRNGFEPGFGLGKNSDGIIEPIQIPEKLFKYGLGYVPTKVDEERNNKKKVDWELPKPLPHLYQSFPVCIKVISDGLGEGIGSLFEECNVILEEVTEAMGIRQAKQGEQLQNWTSTPLLTPRSLG